MSPAATGQGDVPASWLTPRPSREAPIHRWFVFPHSYAPELVDWLLASMMLPPRSVVLDPFCGAGTTLVAAQRSGFESIGVDLLPLATLVSRAKTCRPTRRALRDAARRSIAAARRAHPAAPPGPVLDRAFTPAVYGRLAAAFHAAGRGTAGECVQVAILSISRRFSRLVADGGWLRQAQRELPPTRVPEELARATDVMIGDLNAEAASPSTVIQDDARKLPLPDASVHGVITSPPYPNRHDYTRVFAVELELGFQLGDRVKALRYKSMRSHPEARAAGSEACFDEPRSLSAQIAEVAERHPDPRICRMLRGYFGDLHDVLGELHRVLVRHGQAALVVGNAQYCGVSIPVDDHLAEIATMVGFAVDDVRAVRIRGNSAQQMAAHGRRPSRESVVLLRR